MKFIFLNSRLQINMFSSLSSLRCYGHCGLGSFAGAESVLTWRPAKSWPGKCQGRPGAGGREERAGEEHSVTEGVGEECSIAQGWGEVQVLLFPGQVRTGLSLWESKSMLVGILPIFVKGFRSPKSFLESSVTTIREPGRGAVLTRSIGEMRVRARAQRRAKEECVVLDGQGRYALQD